MKDTGREVVVGSGYQANDDAHGLALIAVSGRLALVSESDYDRYSTGGCESQTLRVLGLETGETVRRGSFTAPGEACDTGPSSADPTVLTPGGGAAWLHGGVLRALRADGKVAEIDRGAITGLRVQAETVFWTRDGVERSAAL